MKINVEEINTKDFYTEDNYKAIQLACICYGKEESKNPKALYKKLAKEGTDTTPYSKVFEFIPAIIDTRELTNILTTLVTTSNTEVFKIKDVVHNYLLRFCYIAHPTVYTNKRAINNFCHIVKQRFNVDLVIPIKDSPLYDKYRVFKLKIPKFIYAQLRTHSHSLSWLCQSSRYTDIQDYWLPSDKYTVEQLLNLTPIEFEELLKADGYKREVYSRGMEGFKYVECYVGGWDIDDLAFTNFIKLRSISHTQEQTREEVIKVLETLF